MLTVPISAAKLVFVSMNEETKVFLPILCSLAISIIFNSIGDLYVTQLGHISTADPMQTTPFDVIVYGSMLLFTVYVYPLSAQPRRDGRHFACSKKNTAGQRVKRVISN